ncbi:hypothetical protein [Flexibacterium corallicola]|uniref:hypothetical protein n=1 Tax=Flexibacterium corallicola TaxID=3037259 RepID=UPI00286F0FA9|nr:hypothetical protein [Pseudovibrio sp. M1P-2-3]
MTRFFVVLSVLAVGLVAYALSSFQVPVIDITALNAKPHNGPLETTPKPKTLEAEEYGRHLGAATSTKDSQLGLWGLENRRHQAKGNLLVSVFELRQTVGPSELDHAENLFFGGHDEGVIYDLPKGCEEALIEKTLVFECGAMTYRPIIIKNQTGFLPL